VTARVVVFGIEMSREFEETIFKVRQVFPVFAWMAILAIFPSGLQ
jgi:hypothetical protein